MLLQQQRMSQDTLELNQRLEEVEAEKRRIEQELSSARERLERARNDNMQVLLNFNLGFNLSKNNHRGVYFLPPPLQAPFRKSFYSARSSRCGESAHILGFNSMN